MATQRLVNTNFWKDTYVIDLDPTQKLLFLYFLTNPRTTLAGVYEISLREVAFDTGIDKDMVEKILSKFCDDEKMYFHKGWLILRNFVKHQRMNPSIKTGIEKAVKDLPDWLQTAFKDFSAFFAQQALDLSVTQQSDDRLGTVSPQKKLKEAKLSKAKLSNTTDVVLAKTPSIEIDSIFAYWQERVGYVLDGKRKSNRYAASNLLKKHGPDRLKRLIDGVALSHEDIYAPRISDFCDLQKKQNDLLVWGKKKGVTNAKRAVDLTK